MRWIICGWPESAVGPEHVGNYVESARTTDAVYRLLKVTENTGLTNEVVSAHVKDSIRVKSGVGQLDYGIRISVSPGSKFGKGYIWIDMSVLLLFGTGKRRFYQHLMKFGPSL